MDSSAQQTLTVGQVAVLLNTQPWNVRRWADYHKAHLSEYSGQQRRFTQQDVDTLRAVAQWRAAGLTAAEVNQRLEQVEIGEIVTADSTETLPAAQEAPQAQETMIEALAVVISPLAARVEALEQNKRDTVVVFAAGFLCACGLFLLLLLLFILYSRP